MQKDIKEESIKSINTMDKKVIAIAYNFVGEVVLAILVGFFAGWYLDKWLNTSPLFLILLMLAGVFGSIYLLIRRVNKVEDKNEKEE